MGKTIQTIAMLLEEPRKKPNLVVAPTVWSFKSIYLKVHV